MPLGGLTRGHLFPDPGEHDQQRLDIAKRNAEAKFPRLKRLGVAVQPGSGPGYAEFFPAEEAFNVNPGVPTVEVRERGLKEKGVGLENVIAGDLLHDAKTSDPEFARLRDKFTRELSPKSLDFASKKYARLRKSGEEDRSFEQWMDDSWVDALIRGKITPDSNDEFRGHYSDEEVRNLDAIEALLKQP